MTSIPDGLKIRPAFISTAVSANTLAVAPNTSSSHHNMFNRLSVALSLVVTFCSLTSAAPQATSAEQLEQDQETGQLLEKVLPTLESSVELVDRHDELPEKTINPFDHDQASNQSSIDKLLDDAIEALEVAKVTECFALLIRRTAGVEAPLSADPGFLSQKRTGPFRSEIFSCRFVQ